jgi:DNA gyrase subunit A
MAEGEKIIRINIEEEMKTAYIDYSMSVIVSRALPDIRDGLKPVHRRVLFGMYELGVLSNRPYKKSARIVGEVLGKYHPHGDSSVYDTMVRMAQEWSLRYPLVDGQGNFGSIDGDSPAAMRYTEARLKKLAEEMLADIDKETVDFRLNFDDSLEEPTVLPGKVPNLLLNGASGIAVGMATNMAPHNLTEVVDGIIAYIDNRDIDIPGLMQYIKAPDFPTGGAIYGYDGVKEAFETGRGRIMMRAKSNVEVDKNGREKVIITEIPYMVNKSDLIKKIADLVNDKKIEGISDIRDESDRDGMRIVFEVKRDAIPNVVLNQLYKHSDLQTAFNVNNIALVKGRPMMLTLKDMIYHYVEHRHEVVVRRTQYELNQALKRAHILEGYIIALDHLDAVIKLIRESASPDIAREGLMSNFGLSEIQSKAILEMRLRALTSLEIDKIRAEYDELMKLIERLKLILADEGMRMQIIKDELKELKDKYGDNRRTEIIYAGGDFRMEDMIADEEVVITISRMGYIKRTLLSEYRTQNRGGRGMKGSATRDEDFLEHMFTATLHNYMLFFTEQGRCFWLRAYEVPEGSKSSKGRAIQNMINIPSDDKVKAYICVKDLNDTEYLKNNFIVMCTQKGTIKKTSLEAYSRPRSNGINAITVREGDMLVCARLTDGKSEIMMASRLGKLVRFNEEKIRPMGRNASGVRGIRIAEKGDEVIGMITATIPSPELSIMVVSEKGYGKRSDLEEYRITNRGGKGVKTINITEKTGRLISILDVKDTDDIMIINRSGLTIRMKVDSIRIAGRATQGVRLINLGTKDSIAAVTAVERDEEEETVVPDNTELTNEENPDLGNDDDGDDEPETDADNDTTTDEQQ